MTCKRNVWLFARPLSGTRWLPTLAKSSDGKFHLCHWGVLVTNITAIDIRAIALKEIRNFGSLENIILGTMYELKCIDNDKNSAHVQHDFGTSDLSLEWRSFSTEYIGDTEMSDIDISKEGFPIILIKLLILKLR